MASRGRKTLRTSWWAQQWLKNLESFGLAGRSSRVRSYVRNGNIQDIIISSGSITANVKGNRKDPYKVDIALKTLSPDEWEKVLDALAGKAIYSAKMLAGEMPDNIEEVFSALDVSLFPASANDLSARCTCEDWPEPCRHMAVVCYALALEFARNPFVLFKLRGMDKEQIIEAIRKRRTKDTGTLAVGDAKKVAEAEELSQSMEQDYNSQPVSQSGVNYWTGRMKNCDIKIVIEPPLVEQSILKRLGEPLFL